MASYGQAMPMARPGHQQQAAVPAMAAGAAVPFHHHSYSGAPQGTFSPGTKIQVGSHRVVIQKYLSEGGFAHVYLVKLPTPVDGTDLAVLKRVAVPDKDSLRGMRTEVETMKRLKGHRAIVTYIDSHASEMHGGGYEVFLLMEFCDGGGLMDFMNTRLQHRLTEPEILGIFSDVAEGVACMHYLRPPLLHRDLKVENVLISTGSIKGARRRFKLCDFGSAAPPRPAPVSVVECRLMDEDVQKHTTLQYRSPEMVDVYRRQPIDEKSDIWALGVLLYKLCYYTTPFEDQSSQLAILNASYRFPSHPVFSERLKSLIASMLRENQQSRPNIYEVLREACVMQGKDVPIKDIYSGRSQSESRTGQHASISAQSTAAPVLGAVFAPPAKQQQIIPEVVPMRRGRPTAPVQSSSRSSTSRPTPSPRPITSGDPFAALDANSSKSPSTDELSSRFPTLDQFALLHDQGAEFSFEETIVTSASMPSTELHMPKDIGQRVAERLADDAFAASAPKTIPQAAAMPQATAPIAAVGKAPINNEPAGYKQYPRAGSSPERNAMPPLVPIKPREVSRASAIISSTPELRAISAQKEQQTQQEEQKQSPVRPEMVSTGTMTSPSPPLPPRDSSRPRYHVFHFPSSSQHRASSVPRKNFQDDGGGYSGGSSRISPPLRSQNQSQPGDAHYPSSSRPSLEGGRPVPESLESAVISTQPRSIRPRPVSAYLESNMDYLREMEGSGGSSGSGNNGNNGNNGNGNGNGNGSGSGSGSGIGGWPLLSPGMPPSKSGDMRPSSSPRLTPSSGGSGRDESAIESNVDYLRAMEDDNKWDKGYHHHHHHHGRHGSKRSSMTALSGTKSMLAGKFGDAFKRFETNTSSSSSGPARTPSPLKQIERQDHGSNSGSGGGSGNSGGNGSEAFIENEDILAESDDMSPEVRREIERRRLSMEEKRVAAAGAEYRQRLASRGAGGAGGGGGGGSGGDKSHPIPAPPKSIGGVLRAVSIQNRVQSLLNESQAAAHTTRTAQGYGHFTDDTSDDAGTGAGAAVGGGGDSGDRPELRKKPLVRTGTASSTAPASMEASRSHVTGGGSKPPPAKPKPLHLNSRTNTLDSTASGGRSSLDMARPGSPTIFTSKRPVNVGIGRLTGKGGAEVLSSSVAAEPTQLMAVDLPGQPVLEGMSLQDRDDYIRDFQRRFPSLTTIEMVERDLAAEEQDRGR